MAELSKKPDQRVSCPCGTTLKVDPMKGERRARCPSCGLVLDFVVTLNEKSRKPSVSIVVSPEAMNVGSETLATLPHAKAKEVSPPEPAPAPSESARTRVGGRTVKAVLGSCICGASFPVDDRELTSIQACPKCGIEYHVVVKLEPGTRKKTAILVPVKTVPVRRQTIPPPPAGTKSIKKTQVIKAGKGRTGAVPMPASPSVAGAQIVACFCGEQLQVRKRDVAPGLECPSCHRGLRFQEVIHPQTLQPMICIVKEPKK
jgi:hypothetical protein